MQKMEIYQTVVAKSGQVNTPPGSYNTVKEWIRNSFLDRNSKVLEVGCTSGFISIELARYAQAKTFGIDIHEGSVKSASVNAAEVPAEIPGFCCADAGRLPFADSMFSHVVIGGHLPFIPEATRADHVREAIRTVRPWGYVLSALYYYHTAPPEKFVKVFNEKIGTHLQPQYDYSYWAEFFPKELDVEYEQHYSLQLPDENRINEYVNAVAPEYQDKWRYLADLFAENGKYMRFFVKVFRKVPSNASLRQIPRGGIYSNFNPIASPAP